MRPHQLQDECSLAMHSLIAARLRDQPGLLTEPRARAASWLSDHSVHPTYALAWAELLAGPLERLLGALVDPGETATALRHCSPFAGLLDQRTRWQVYREVRGRLGMLP